MGKSYERLDDRLSAFIKRQHVFFVATAPSGGVGHVNLSPKGLDSFRILSPTTIAYQDLVGSGAETIAHVRQNGRITFLFCAFEGPPLLLRLYGTGKVLEPGQAEFEALAGQFPDRLAFRTIIHASLHRIADSCGFGVPLFHFVKERDQLIKWAERKGSKGIVDYKRDMNVTSIDGLPALKSY